MSGVVTVVLGDPVSGEYPTAMKLAIAEKITNATAPTANNTFGLIALGCTSGSCPSMMCRLRCDCAHQRDAHQRDAHQRDAQ